MNDINQRIAKRKHVIKITIITLSALVLVCIAIGIYLLMLWKNGVSLNRDTMFVPKTTQEVNFERNAASETSLPAATPSPTAKPYNGKPTVELNGKYYVLNENVFSILFMGIDATDRTQFETIGVSAHQTDSLILAVIDSQAGTLKMINVPRMSIAEVKQLDMAFNYARTTKSPICIQYAFGDGKELSCTLTRDAVSNLLFNIPISRYITLNIDGLIKANDAIGGVTLTLADDMSDINPKMKKGESYTLIGRDAEVYIRARSGENLDGTSMSRTRRQIQYYKAFFSTAKAKLKQDPMFAVNLYGTMGNSVQTDLSMDEMIYLSKTVINMDINEENIFTLEGTVKNEDFFVDDAALKELLIKVFYTEVPD